VAPEFANDVSNSRTRISNQPRKSWPSHSHQPSIADTSLPRRRTLPAPRAQRLLRTIRRAQDRCVFGLLLWGWCPCAVTACRQMQPASNKSLMHSLYASRCPRRTMRQSLSRFRYPTITPVFGPEFLSGRNFALSPSAPLAHAQSLSKPLSPESTSMMWMVPVAVTPRSRMPAPGLVVA